MLTDDAVVYGYVGVPTGSTVTHFAFITWIGPAVSPLKKAKVSTDKAFVKQLMPSFAKEILADNKADLDYDKVMQMLAAASGAAYSTGR
ncbi:COTL1 [Bugula neritina]|uniref:COTL1 n=1 Tax=Bugula neritina TaxID=10212 RepID=A0A7J7JE85_BUGNE|nr:COTL1 [Bugula neritina]